MREKIKTFLCVIIVVVVLPLGITFLMQHKKAKIETSELEQLLVQMVANEIPLSYEMECLKAQVVLARTNLLFSKENGEIWPVNTIGEEDFTENLRNLIRAIQETEGVVLTYRGNIIYGPYHRVSAGVTRNGVEGLGREDMPWLTNVDSLDLSSQEFLRVTFFEKEEFLNRLKEYNSAIETTDVAIQSRDKGGYVILLKVGDTLVGGEDFRQKLGLCSACFYIKEVDGKIRVVTKGLGHGLGMSQFGANQLAKEGKSYQEILSYYFKNVEISD